MKLLLSLSVAVVLLIIGASTSHAIDPHALPVGWDEMSEARQQQFASIRDDYAGQYSEVKPSQEEYAGLSKAERRVVNSAMKGLEQEYLGTLDEAGFELEVEVLARIAAAVDEDAPLAAAPGAIVYDDGIQTGVPTISSLCWGNRFDTASGNPVADPGTVTRMTFFIDSGSGTDNVFVSLFDQQSGTTANVLTSSSVPLNNGPGTFNTHTFGSVVFNGGLLAGVWSFGSGDQVGLGSGTVNGQGHHGMRINDIVGTGYTELAGLNALVRVTGPNLIPVELMKFEIKNDGESPTVESNSKK